MINAGDTGFVLLSAALVMVMTPGLAFFYGGLVRRKNFLTIMLTPPGTAGCAAPTGS